MVDSLYSRNEVDFSRGNFRVKGDTVDVFLAYHDYIIRTIFWGDEIESIESVDPLTGVTIERLDSYRIFPANLFVTTKERIFRAVDEIQIDLGEQVEFFKSIGKPLEAKRLYERVTFDVEMIKEIGYCSGIENYSRYFDGREPGTRPFCLLDFFPKRLPHRNRRKPRNPSTNKGYVWWRPFKKTKLGRVWFPFASSHRQPSPQIRRV